MLKTEKKLIKRNNLFKVIIENKKKNDGIY